MNRQLPFLALNSVGKTILNDYPIKMFDNTTKKETTKMTNTLSADQLSRYVGMRIRNPAAADRYWARCHGRNIAADTAMDDESIAALKDFLQSKLRPEDHKAACALMDGAGNGEPEPDSAEDKSDLPKTAIDAKIGFDQRYPGLAHIVNDASGIQPRSRGGSYSDVAAKSFADRYPGLQGIKQA